MHTEERAQLQKAWDQIATGYDEHVTSTHLPLAQRAFARVALKKGMRFLDVACGSGALSIPAARLGAEVTAVDISPAMIERLRNRAQREGVTIRALVMDGQQLELEDDTFDVSGSQFGVMLFPDLPRGLRELVRVTKPGGRVFLNVFGPPEEVEFLAFFIRAMKEADPGFQGLPKDPPPLPFQVADPAKLAAQLSGAGLKDVRVETGTEELTFESADQMWSWLVSSNPIPVQLTAHLTPDQRSAVIGNLGRMLRERAGGDGPAVLTNPVHIGSGIKPA